MSDTTTPDTPQVIAGRALRKYGVPVSHQIACELESLAQFAEHGRAFGNPIPEKYKRAARRWLPQCRAAVAATGAT